MKCSTRGLLCVETTVVEEGEVDFLHSLCKELIVMIYCFSRLLQPIPSRLQVLLVSSYGHPQRVRGR